MLVSALLLPERGQMKHTPDTYISSLRQIAATGIPLTLFVDPKIEGVPLGGNVTIKPLTIRELPLFQLVDGKVLVLPNGANAPDTRDYLTIQNSKASMVRAVAEETKAPRVSWIDAGLCHMLADPHGTLLKLHTLGNAPEGVSLPGCVAQPKTFTTDQVLWRFAGSFFTATNAAALLFDDVNKYIIHHLLPRLTWEVNVWALAELSGRCPMHWYQADHNDTILTSY